MKTVLLVMAVMLSAGLSACDDPQVAARAVTAMGLTPVHVGGYAWFGCGQDDDFTTSFTAISPKGETVTGVVCSGWFKGATVRLY